LALWIAAAGVTRAILFEENADNVEALRFHDLRSTFCTWARRAGKSDAWISERTGHEVTVSMINRYDRGARRRSVGVEPCSAEQAFDVTKRLCGEGARSIEHVILG
jgi:hypothetical protein